MLSTLLTLGISIWPVVRWSLRPTGRLRSATRRLGYRPATTLGVARAESRRDDTTANAESKPGFGADQASTRAELPCEPNQPS
jgi:hypothetical protein